MKIGIPIWGDKISPVLDTASRLLVMRPTGKKSLCVLRPIWVSKV